MFRALHESGCDVAQGYLLSRPMPVGDLPRFFAAVADISLSRALTRELRRGRCRRRFGCGRGGRGGRRRFGCRRDAPWSSSSRPLLSSEPASSSWAQPPFVGFVLGIGVVVTASGAALRDGCGSLLGVVALAGPRRLAAALVGTRAPPALSFAFFASIGLAGLVRRLHAACRTVSADRRPRDTNCPWFL